MTLAGVTEYGSVNFNDRAPGSVIDTLVLHYTGMESAFAARTWLCKPESEVSAHYFIEEDGGIFRLVDEEMRAWHAGRGSWRGHEDINSRSIGIEIVNPGHEWGYRPFPDEQIEAVTALCGDIVSRRPIPARNVIAHSDMAPFRKQDPGELFPWDRLHACGVGHWVEPVPIEEPHFTFDGYEDPKIVPFQEKLAAYGYEIAPNGIYDGHLTAVVRAFQRHFRPAKVDGLADHSTLQTLDRLLAALPDQSACRTDTSEDANS